MTAREYRLGGYAEWPAPDDLKACVDAVWQYAHPAESKHQPMHRLLPDASASLSYRVERDGSELEIIAPIRKPRVYEPRGGVDVVAVRIRPEWIAQLLEISPHDHDGGIVPVRSMRADSLRRELERSRDREGRIRLLLDFVRGAVARTRPSRDAVLAHAAADLLRRSARVADVAETLAISERHLRRIFRAATAVSPKYLSRLMRASRLVMRADSLARPRWSDLAVDGGFCDQAHFIEELRDLTGLTPSVLHRERRAQTLA